MDISSFSRSQKWLLVVGTALLWWLAGFPTYLFWLGWLAFVPLFLLISSLPPWQRFKWGYLAGFVSYFLINWWVILAISRGAPAIGASAAAGFFLGILAVALIAVIQGFGVAVLCLLWRRSVFTNKKVLLLWPLVLAAVWWGLEWLRAQSVLGHTWGALAYTQWSDLYSLQIASVVGRHGLSAWCVWLAVMIAIVWQLRNNRQLQRLAGAALLLGLIGVHLWGAFLYYKPLPQPAAQLRVLLVQTAVPGLIKNSAERNAAFEEAQKLTQKYFSNNSADLVMWPETTFEQNSGSADSMRDEKWARNFVQGHNVPLLAGTSHWMQNGQHFNEATLFSPNGAISGNAKKWLVPFGERAPLGQYIPFLKRFAPQPAVSPAAQKVSLTMTSKARIIKLGTVICFESSFAAPFHRLYKRGAQLMAALTNDDWFAGSEAPFAHAAMSTLAAVENRTAVVQAANGGYSFGIDRKGRFRAKSTFGTPQVVVVTVPVNKNE